MNREDIIRMAREAEIPGSWDLNWFDPYLDRFAALVAAHEREVPVMTELVIDCPRCGHCCPERQWVGLTDEEVQYIADSEYEETFVRLIEAKLKEKNGG